MLMLYIYVEQSDVKKEKFWKENSTSVTFLYIKNVMSKTSFLLKQLHLTLFSRDHAELIRHMQTQTEGQCI